MTALTIGRASEQSLAISTAIFTAPYTVLQIGSLDDSDSLSAISEEGEAIARAIALDEAQSTLRSFVRGCNSFMYSIIGDVGAPGG